MKKKINNNKSFGILFSIVFLIVAFWPILNDNQIRVWSLIVSLIFLLLGITRSRFLTPLNLGWIKFGKEMTFESIIPKPDLVMLFSVISEANT